MKTVTELLSGTALYGSAEHKRAGLTKKRVAGGLRSEIGRADVLGLTKQEKDTLIAAAVLLEKMADLQAKAFKQLAATEKKKADRRAAVEKELRKVFVLQTIADRVCFIGATHSRLLTGGHIKSSSDVDYYVGDELGTLAYTLASDPAGRDAVAVVREAWEKFQGARAELEAKHRGAISMLSS